MRQTRRISVFFALYAHDTSGIKINRFDKHKVIISVKVMADKCAESQPASLTLFKHWNWPKLDEQPANCVPVNIKLLRLMMRGLWFLYFRGTRRTITNQRLWIYIMKFWNEMSEEKSVRNSALMFLIRREKSFLKQHCVWPLLDNLPSHSLCMFYTVNREIIFMSVFTMKYVLCTS